MQTLITSSTEEIKKILQSSKTIAIIGCSPKEDKASHIVAKYLQNAGYKIIPVYPKEEYILGEKVYKSLEDIPFSIDIVDVFRKSKEIDKIVDICIKRKDVKVIWTQLDLVNNEACLKAINASIKVVQDRCTKIEHSNI
ncbi:MAG: CoA-binding protein [Campylobacteraceae bacterium]|nr:CoA-binding protein [Campylobacteraceae bacterium]